MLILAREVDQKVHITLPDGRVIEVMVIEIKHGSVRIGFQADRDITIHRSEVTERINLGVRR